MKFTKLIRGIVLAIIVFTLLFFVGTALVQGPEGDDDGAAPVDPGSEGVIGEEGIILAQPPYTMNYQGFLTDSSGNPLNGSYNMVFQLYDDALAGTVEWGPETHSDVPVTDGLFQVALGITVNLQPNDFDEALFLAITVNGTAVTPRQPLRSVPYAFGLVPGAEVQGDPDASNYALRVENTGLGLSDRGLYVKGEEYGIYAEEVGAGGDIGIYSPDFVYAKGYKSAQDSYLWVPGNIGVLYPTSGCTLYQQWHGSVRLECSTSSYTNINFPITVPGVLFGQDVRVMGITVYYDLDNASSFINSTNLRKLTAAGSSDGLISDYTNRTSTSPTSYSLSATENYTLTATSGALNLRLSISHDGDTTHDVNVGGVRVQLRHYD